MAEPPTDGDRLDALEEEVVALRKGLESLEQTLIKLINIVGDQDARIGEWDQK